jgi:hypothetical protein
MVVDVLVMCCVAAVRDDGCQRGLTALMLPRRQAGRQNQ